MRGKKNELTPSIDGTDRLTVNIKVRMSLDDMAHYLTAYGYMIHDFATHTYEDGYVADMGVIRAVLTSRQAAVKVAQDCIWSNGVERAGYVIGDENLHEVRDAVLAHLRTLWPGETT